MRPPVGALDSPVVDSALVDEHKEVGIIELGNFQLPEGSKLLVTFRCPV